MTTAEVMASATLCMVLVHNTRKSAPASSRARARAASRSPARLHWPDACSASMSAKSTESSRMRAEWTPPSRSRTSSFASR